MIRSSIFAAWAVSAVILFPLRPAFSAVDDALLNPIARALEGRETRGRDDILFSLRKLKDPALRPFFASLSSGSSAVVRRQGVLGLAELEAPPRINPMMLSRLEDPAERAAILGEALSKDMVGVEQIESMLGWSTLDPYTELVLRSRLVRLGKDSIDKDRVWTLAKDSTAPNQVVAAMLLARAGDSSHLKPAIERLMALEEPARGTFVATLLEHVRREGGPEASMLLGAVSKTYASEPGLQADILRTWMKVDAAASASAWNAANTRAREAGALSDRLRLALGALDGSTHVDGAWFEKAGAVAASEDLPSIVLAAARAIASKKGEPEALKALVEAGYRPADLWLAENLSDLQAEAGDAAARALLDAAAARGSLIAAVSDAVPKAAEFLVGKDPAPLSDMLAKARERDDGKFAQAVLFGMLSAGAGPAWAPGVRWPDGPSEAIALLIEARTDPSFAKDAQRMDRLRAVAQGIRGNLPAGMKAQAAWLALRHEGNAEVALAKLLGR